MTNSWQYRTAEWGAGFIRSSWKDDDLEDLTLDEGLNRLGGNGWELVSVFAKSFDGMNYAQTFVFKKAHG